MRRSARGHPTAEEHPKASLPSRQSGQSRSGQRALSCTFFSTSIGLTAWARPETEQFNPKLKSHYEQNTSTDPAAKGLDLHS